MASTNQPPPPYPGQSEMVGQPSYPPVNPSYQAPDNFSKTAQGMPPAYPQAYPPYNAWPGGYGQPGQPAVYGPAYGMPGNYNQSTAVIMTQPTVTVVQVFRDIPVHMNCPHCQAEIVTGTYFETGTFTWVLCLILFLVGCSLGCCLIPFCVDNCKDVVHTCPNCRQQIARYSRM